MVHDEWLFVWSSRLLGFGLILCRRGVGRWCQPGFSTNRVCRAVANDCQQSVSNLLCLNEMHVLLWHLWKYWCWWFEIWIQWAVWVFLFQDSGWMDVARRSDHIFLGWGFARYHESAFDHIGSKGDLGLLLEAQPGLCFVGRVGRSVVGCDVVRQVGSGSLLWCCFEATFFAEIHWVLWEAW